MKKDTKPPKGVSKSNVPAPATAGAPTQQQPSSQRRLGASAQESNVVPMTAPAVSARYIDSRMKQFCLR